jgi:small-conductance mechanosensitive channel
MAARPTLGNLTAGIQIALAEPIRIEDAVVVEGELGRVVEVNTTCVIVHVWDLRRLVVPLSYFIEKPFQNWTSYSSDFIGVVLLYTDYTVPVDKLREEYRKIPESSPLWDRKVMAVQVTDAKERSVELRFLMSAGNPTTTFDLRCYVRERLIQYLQQHYSSTIHRHLREFVPRSRWLMQVRRDRALG